MARGNIALWGPLLLQAVHHWAADRTGQASADETPDRDKFPNEKQISA